MISRRRIGSTAVLAVLMAGLGVSDAPLRDGSGVKESAKKAGFGSPGAGSVDARRAAAYWSDRVMVRLAPGADVVAVAAAHDLEVLRAAGPSGLVTLGSNSGRAVEEIRAALGRDARVQRALPSGRVRGAGASSVVDYQWHLAEVASSGGAVVAEGVTVAVLDTGVAHGAGCEAVPGLEKVEVVSPLDLVGDSALACDDHQHGTHIASLIASDGDLPGVARGAALMPVKVLDEDNEGDEQALIDGILWAVSAGADVINLSLSFEPGYTPSPDLLAALRAAHEAEVIMVAAAGNNGGDTVTWPAASPLVIAVAAGAVGEGDELTPATYADLGPEVDLVAPGGALDLDRTRDGYGDGVLAETIDPGSPSSSGYWFYEGSSQAAALVSGAAAALLAAGAEPADVLPTLQRAADALGEGWRDGVGAGSLNLEAALTLIEVDDVVAGEPVYAAILPYLLRDTSNTKLVPMARVSVLDADGEPVVGAEVFGRADSAGASKIWRCETDSRGFCKVSLPMIAATDADGAPVELAWRFTVDAVTQDDGTGASPTALVVANDTLEALSCGLAELGVSEATLAFSWSAKTDARLGTLAEGLTLMDAGRGGATAPQALLLSAPLASALFDFEALTLDLSGTGVATDALGVVAERASAGSGVATDALGVSEGSAMVRVSGSGVATDALGVTALSMVGQRTGEDHGLSVSNTTVFPGEASAEDALKDTWTEEAMNLSGAPRGASVVHALSVHPDLGATPESSSSAAAEGELLR